MNVEAEEQLGLVENVGDDPADPNAVGFIIPIRNQYLNIIRR